MAISLIPSSVLSTQEAMPVSSSTGTASTTHYLCNLCHSLENEYPYPPPSSEQSVVRFADANEDNIEAFGMPWDRGITCIDVWNKVLDFQNPYIVDESSCRNMAAVYAPQCCNDNDNDNDSDTDNGAVPAENENENNNNTNENIKYKKENNKHKYNLRRTAS